jgi:hypothetical protein
VSPAALDAAAPGAWQRYDQLIGLGELHPWERFMQTLLGGAAPELSKERCAELAAWLFSEQPRKNLWRHPIAGMVELAAELAAAGIRVGVISNSEGKLAALFDEIGWNGRFAVIADSGALGIEKPDPGIFEWTCKELGVEPTPACGRSGSARRRGRSTTIGRRRAGTWRRCGRRCAAGACRSDAPAGVYSDESRSNITASATTAPVAVRFDSSTAPVAAVPSNPHVPSGFHWPPRLRWLTRTTRSSPVQAIVNGASTAWSDAAGHHADTR